MKIFLLGDTLSPDGPGIANAAVAEALRMHHDLTVSLAEGNAARILEAVKGILKSNVTVICSKSALNRFAVRFAGWLRKPVFYIMHGYASLEAVLNGEVTDGSKEHAELRNYDRMILSGTDCVICVSPFAMQRLREDFPEYGNRLEYIWNAVPLPESRISAHEGGSRILSVGADQRIKNCKPLADAVGLLRRDGVDISLVLVGKKRGEYETLSKKDGVIWKDPMPHDELLKLMRTCSIYVQCSLFDTFAMAPVEALLTGNSILLSDRVGCKDLFPGLLPEEMITAPEDPEAIAAAIRGLLERGGNRERLTAGSALQDIGIPALAERLNMILTTRTERR